ncbi:MAG: ubiquinone/menaquinone biosynthesis C-methylase UbiE [Candidatus Paceibacteria bacterium]|jgi:ubiquinone/menaquinone biosynthesis C-methylase UbiE
MTKPSHDSAFTQNVAQFYEASLVPLIFEPYAEDLAERACACAPEVLLEVACGTGVVTRALAKSLPATTSITASDLNLAMLEHAQSIGTEQRVTWRQANVMELPFDDHSMDLVVCQFAIMFFPDRVAAYLEIRRVLRPGGKFLFNVWNDIERNEFASVITSALGELYSEDPPLFLARTPHAHGHPGEIESDLAAAGFEGWSFHQKEEQSVASSARAAAIAYCHGTPLRGEIEARDPGGLERATDHTMNALQARFGEGTIRAKISAVVAQARKPLS